MTYSNRSYSSPFQHGTEFGKTDNSVVIDKINPFVFGKFSMPGTWSDPYSHSKPSDPDLPPVEYADKAPARPLDQGTNPIIEESPICSWGATYGDNTASLCRPPPFNYTPPTCPMERPMYPERIIDPGMWVYNREEANKLAQKKAFPMDVVKFILFLGLLILLARLAVKKSKA